MRTLRQVLVPQTVAAASYASWFDDSGTLNASGRKYRTRFPNPSRQQAHSKLRSAWKRVGKLHREPYEARVIAWTK